MFSCQMMIPNMDTTPDAYHAALQFEEYKNGVDDAEHWQEGCTEDDVIEEEDQPDTDVFWLSSSS